MIQIGIRTWDSITLRFYFGLVQGVPMPVSGFGTVKFSKFANTYDTNVMF